MSQLDQLQHYRQGDIKNVEGEVKPENETLNSRYLRDFLRTKMGMETGRPTDEESLKRDLDHFDDHFKLTTAIDLAAAKGLDHKQTHGEKEILNVLTKARSYLEQNGKLDLFEDMNPKSALSSLERLTKENDYYASKFPALKEAYFTYRTVRLYCRRIFEVERVALQDREKQKVEIGGNWKEGLAKEIEGVKGHFAGMSGGEKLTIVAAALIGTSLFLTSERTESWREKLFTMVKLGFGAVAANTLWKLFTGKTAVHAIGDWVHSTAGNEDFWKKSLRTSAENAEIVRASLIYLNDHDFLDLAERYRQVKSTGAKKIDLASVSSKDLTPEQTYTALDVFFSQYGGANDSVQNAENLSKRFRNYKPRAKWLEVVSTLLVEDGRLEFKGNLPQRVANETGAYMTMAWNAAAVTATGKAVGEAAETAGEAAGTVVSDVGKGTKEVVGTTYNLGKRVVKPVWGVAKGATEMVVSGVEIAAYPVAWLGKWCSDRTTALLDHEPKPEEVKKFQKEKLFNINLQKTAAESTHAATMEEFLKNKVNGNVLSREDADVYLETIHKGQISALHNLKFYKKLDAIYIVSDSPVNSKVFEGQKDFTAEAVEPIRTAATQAWEFLKTQGYSQQEAEAHSKIGVGVYENGFYKLFIRMPKRGTAEFDKAVIIRGTQGKTGTLRKNLP